VSSCDDCLAGAGGNQGCSRIEQETGWEQAAGKPPWVVTLIEVVLNLI